MKVIVTLRTTLEILPARDAALLLVYYRENQAHLAPWEPIRDENYLTANERSGHVLEKLGFEKEGYARRYLKIAGQWEDHVLTARVKADK